MHSVVGGNGTQHTAPEQGRFPADGRLISRADGSSFGSPIAYVFIASWAADLSLTAPLERWVASVRA
jgi:hypothetical protein